MKRSTLKYRHSDSCHSILPSDTSRIGERVTPEYNRDSSGGLQVPVCLRHTFGRSLLESCLRTGPRIPRSVDLLPENVSASIRRLQIDLLPVRPHPFPDWKHR